MSDPVMSDPVSSDPVISDLGPGDPGPVDRVTGVARINPAELAPPSGFAHAVVARGRTVVALAGQTALDGAGRIRGTDITEQFGHALRNLLTALRAAGGGPADLISLTIYAVDIADYRAHAVEIGRVWRDLAGRDYPAMALVGVTRLWDEEALVEVQGWAAIA